MAAKVNFVVKSVVKQAISKAKMQSSGDVTDALNGLISWYIQEGVRRAKANGRKTVRAYDICTEY